MPLSWVKAKYSDLKSQALGELATELEVEVSEDLVEALAAATSLVAFADGVASPEEREALTAVGVFDDEPDLGRLVIRAALVVGTTDGVLSEAEEAAVKRLCDTLGLDLKDLKQPVKRRHDDPDEDDEDDPVDDKDE